MSLPSKALITALVATAGVALASKNGPNQIVPGKSSAAPEELNVGVKALVLSAALAGTSLFLLGAKNANSYGRGGLYASALAAAAGTFLVVKSQSPALRT